MTDRRYHVMFRDEYSGEELGLIAIETPQLGVTRRLINPYAAKTGMGDAQYSDLTEWTVVAQDDWRGGRGQEMFVESDKWFDSYAAETRVARQLTLGPYPHAQMPDLGAADPPKHDPPGGSTMPFGWAAAEKFSRTEGAMGSTLKPAQKLRPLHPEQLTLWQKAWLRSVELRLWKSGAFPDGNDVTVKIYSDDGGDPSFPDAVIATKVLKGSDVSNIYTEVEFEFDSPIDMNDHPEFWIGLEQEGTTGEIMWASTFGGNHYPRGYAAWELGGTWQIPTHKDSDLCFRANWSHIRVAQQFTTGDAGFSTDNISVYGVWWHKPVRVSLYTDNDGVPGIRQRTCVIGSFGIKIIGADSTTTIIKLDEGQTTDNMWADQWVRIDEELRMISSVDSETQFTLKSALTTVPETGTRVYTGYHQAGHVDGWKKARFDTSISLTATTPYWIVMEHLSDAHNLFNGWSGVRCYAKPGLELPKRQIDNGAWDYLPGLLALAVILYRVGDFGLAGDITAIARFGDSMYCGGGNTVYKWNEAVQLWEVVDTAGSGATTVTDLEVWGGYLWAARGEGSDLRRSSDGSNWSAVTGRTATSLQAGGGYLNYSGAGANSHIVYYTADGTNWAVMGACGPGDYPVRGLAWYRDMLFAATDTRLWCLSLEAMPYPVLDWSAQEHEYNGRGMTAWSKTNCLYIPLRYGLYRWNGDTMVAEGPERGTGLPEKRAGHIVDLCPTNNWLYTAINAGSGNISSVLCYDGQGGWHEIVRHEDLPEPVRCLAFSTLETPSRLWYGIGGETRFVHMPDRGDNPFQWEYFDFQPNGRLITSWFGGDLLEVVKDFHEVVLRSEALDYRRWVDVYLQVDRHEVDGEPLWVYWGEFARSPRMALQWGAAGHHIPAWRQKVIDSHTTRVVLFIEESTAGMRVGDFVEINGEYSQIIRVTDLSVRLGTPLTNAPAPGDIVRACPPAGREFRLALDMRSRDPGPFVRETPKIGAYMIRYQNNVLDRHLWTIQINCRADKDLSGAAYPMTSADLRVELDRWAKRKTPFTLVDPDGRCHTVKVSAAGEGGMMRKKVAGADKEYRSTYNFNLVEVA